MDRAACSIAKSLTPWMVSELLAMQDVVGRASARNIGTVIETALSLFPYHCQTFAPIFLSLLVFLMPQIDAEILLS